MRKDDLRIIISSCIGLWIILILLAILPAQAHAKTRSCAKHPIYCQIKKNNKRMNSTDAYKLSNVIYKASRKHHIPTRIFVAILMQESRYSLEARGCHKGLFKKVTKIKADVPMTIAPPKVEYIEKKVCADFGIGQIWYRTANRYGFDLDKLTTDLNYSVNAAAKVLADFQTRYSAREVDWWVRYNCGARGTTKRDTCQIYKQLVQRYF